LRRISDGRLLSKPCNSTNVCVQQSNSSTPFSLSFFAATYLSRYFITRRWIASAPQAPPWAISRPCQRLQGKTGNSGVCPHRPICILLNALNHPPASKYSATGSGKYQQKASPSSTPVHSPRPIHEMDVGHQIQVILEPRARHRKACLKAGQKDRAVHRTAATQISGIAPHQDRWAA